MRRDATPPGRPTALRVVGGRLRFASPGDDLLCGRPAFYEVSTGGAFARVGAEPVKGGRDRVGRAVGRLAADQRAGRRRAGQQG
jgi:hypothetical protein